MHGPKPECISCLPIGDIQVKSLFADFRIRDADLSHTADREAIMSILESSFLTEQFNRVRAGPRAARAETGRQRQARRPWHPPDARAPPRASAPPPRSCENWT